MNVSASPTKVSGEITLDTEWGWPCKAIWIGDGTGGDLTVTLWDGESQQFKDVQSGQYFEVSAMKITAYTGTLADLVAVTWE